MPTIRSFRRARLSSLFLGFAAAVLTVAPLRADGCGPLLFTCGPTNVQCSWQVTVTHISEHIWEVKLVILCAGAPECSIIASELGGTNDSVETTTCRCNGKVAPVAPAHWDTAGNNCTNYAFTH